MAPRDRPRSEGATAIARRIRSREMSVISVVEDHLDRIATTNDAIGGVAWSDDDSVLDAARAADRALDDGSAPIGPLHGVPITIKDWIDVTGFPWPANAARSTAAPAIPSTPSAVRARAAAVKAPGLQIGRAHV